MDTTNGDTHLAQRFQQQYPDKYKALTAIQKRFNDAGFQIFLVGGAVRNLVLDKKISDLDLASSAHPADIMRMYRSVIPTGIKHGTVTLVLDKEHYEITTFRVDGEYSDARRPDKVSFTADIYEDLKRRDFTINAMALDLGTGTLLDPHGGRDDIAARIIRTVGDPLDRFFEDGLRIVRGIRFASQLGFEIAPQTRSAMSQRLDKLRQVSVERFRDELSKTIAAPGAASGLGLVHELDIDSLFLPELAAAARGKQAEYARAIACAAACPVEPQELRWAALLLCLTDDTERASLLGRLKLPNAFTKNILSFATLGTVAFEPDWSDAELRRFAARRGKEYLFPQIKLMELWRLSGEKPPAPGLYEEFRSRLTHVLATRPPLSIRELAVDGAALKDMAGITPGPVMGVVLDKLLDLVLEDPSRNSVEHLIPAAKELSAKDAKPYT